VERFELVALGAVTDVGIQTCGARRRRRTSSMRGTSMFLGGVL
jgi:hypothetical protein